MVVSLEKRGRHLVEGVSPLGGSATAFSRAGTTDARFSFGQLTVGFVLKPVERHVAAYGSDRRREVPLAPGTGWLIDGGADGQCSWEGPSAFLNVHIDAEVVHEVSDGRNALLPTIYGFHDPLVVEMALAIHSAGGEGGGDASAPLYRETLLRGLVAHLLNATGDVPAVSEPVIAADDPRLDRVLDFIEAHLQDRVSLEDLASVAAMSPFHFARSFKGATGRSPHQYVIARRIERAKLLLRSTSDPIDVIAARVGWQNKSHFSAAFRKAVGATPGEFRGRR